MITRQILTKASDGIPAEQAAVRSPTSLPKQQKAPFPFMSFGSPEAQLFNNYYPRIFQTFKFR